LHVEPFKQGGNDFLIQDLTTSNSSTGSNNPFVDAGSTPNSPQFNFRITSPNTNNSNNLFQTQPPPQNNVAFNVNQPTNPPMTNTYMNPPNNGQNVYNGQNLFGNFNPNPNTYMVHTGATGPTGSQNGPFFTNPNPNPNPMNLDLFGTKTTTTPTNGNDPFANLFTMAVGSNNGGSMTFQTDVNNPFVCYFNITI